MKYIPIFKISLVKEGIHPSVYSGPINSSMQIASIMYDYYKDADRESVVVVMLTAKNHIIGINTVSVGSLSESIIHPREIFKPAILSNSHSIILCHNHPSGDCAISDADIEVTSRIAKAGAILGISLLDHLIIGENSFASMTAQGYLG